MKNYEIIPRNWNESKQNYESDWGDSYNASNYAEAKKIMRKLCKRYDRVDIQLFQINRNDYYTRGDYEEEIQYNMAAHNMWIESYEHGKERPVVYIEGTPIWRWNMQGGPEDLKPRE